MRDGTPADSAFVAFVLQYQSGVEVSDWALSGEQAEAATKEHLLDTIAASGRAAFYRAQARGYLLVTDEMLRALRNSGRRGA